MGTSYRHIGAIAFLSVVFLSIGAPASAFVNKTAALGVGVTPEGGGYGHGCAFVDTDNDGTLELYVVMFMGQSNHLFNYDKQSCTYVDVAGATGCGDDLDGRGVAWADYDNDGDVDFFVANYLGANRLYQNDGTGHFSNVAPAVGMNYTGRCHSAAWGDYDNDGYLDLYVCNYGKSTVVSNANLLYHNNRNGTFTEVADAAGVSRPDDPAFVCTWLDYDSDGDIDLYIGNDKHAGNVLFRNNNNGTFTDVSSASLIDSGPNDRVLINGQGEPWLPMDAMGLAVADYDDNGHLDIFITNTSPSDATIGPGGHALLKNLGNGTFSEVSAQAGVTTNLIGWGTAFLDYDNDGDDDLYIVHEPADNPPTPGGNVLYRNNGNGTFTDVTLALGVGNTDAGYGLTTGDYNDDGFVDIFVNNQGAPSVFYENVPNANCWVKIRPVGTASNRDGLGAKVKVTTASLVQRIDVRCGSSYLSNLSRDVEFGLGSATTIDEIEIRWPSGIVDTWTNIPSKKFFVATEGATLELLPVLFTRFEGEARRGAIALTWSVQSDEAIRGYRMYRRGRGDVADVEISGGFLSADTYGYLDSDVEGGEEYAYTLSATAVSGEETRSETIRIMALVYSFNLQQNHPNPFNPSTRIQYGLAVAGSVELSVYDVCGARVATLVEGFRPAGPGVVDWDGTDAAGRAVASGLYFCRLRAGTIALTRKMILLK